MPYGFQAFEFELAKGPAGRTRLDFKDPLGDGVRAEVRLSNTLQLLKDRDVVLGVPNPMLKDWVEPTDPAHNRGQSALAVERWEPTEDGWLLVHLKQGLVGEFSSAIDKTQRRSLEESAATSDYRALILWPQAGEMGRMAVEAIGIRCPVSPFVRWLGRAEFDANQNSCINYSAHQLTDMEQVKSLASASEMVGVRLLDTTTQKKTKLEFHADTADVKKNIISSAISIADGNKATLQQVEEIAGVDGEALTEAGFTFDRGDLLIDGKIVNGERLRAKFTYPLTKDLPLASDDWARKVTEHMRSRLSAGTDIFDT